MLPPGSNETERLVYTRTCPTARRMHASALLVLLVLYFQNSVQIIQIVGADAHIGPLGNASKSAKMFCNC